MRTKHDQLTGSSLYKLHYINRPLQCFNLLLYVPPQRWYEPRDPRSHSTHSPVSFYTQTPK